jgi:hypothetical protein
MNIEELIQKINNAAIKEVDDDCHEICDACCILIENDPVLFDKLSSLGYPHLSTASGVKTALLKVFLCMHSYGMKEDIKQMAKDHKDAFYKKRQVELTERLLANVREVSDDDNKTE